MTANDENQALSVWARYASMPGGNQNFSRFRSGSAVQIGFRGGDALAWRWGGTILANSDFAPSTGAGIIMYIHLMVQHIEFILMGLIGAVQPQRLGINSCGREFRKV